jgi:hypothetical protein
MECMIEYFIELDLNYTLKKFPCERHTNCVSYRTWSLCEAHTGFLVLTNTIHLCYEKKPKNITHYYALCGN